MSEDEANRVPRCAGRAGCRSSGSAGLAGLADLVDDLARLGSDQVEDAERIDQLRRLEEVKSAAAAAQARITVAFDRSQRAAQAAMGVPARQQGTGVAAQVALSRRESPVNGARHLGLARALVQEMPHTLAALERGEISEWRATLLVRETACLSRSDRSTVDAELSTRPGGLGSPGDRAMAEEARRVAYRLDPHSFTDRARRAESDRRVTCRPAPDTMAVLSALLPAKQGIAVFAALSRAADTRRCAGDGRTRGQLMADTLVERVTGQSTASEVPVEVNMVMTDSALLGGHVEPVHLEGYGPLPAPLVREDLRDQPEDVRAWVRRLYVDPRTGALVAMESTRRRFEGQLRRFVIVRDQRCRTPWCDAPVRHVDHVCAAARGGRTTTANAQGLCESCNLAKESEGWHSTSRPGGVVVTRTPTGHRYRSRPPPLAGCHGPPLGDSRTAEERVAGSAPSRVDIFFSDLILTA